jgi:Kdo2-lipid IVA lauroyltransferase/acyltransferase
MQFVAYILIYPLLWCISMLPFRVLYLLSDIVYQLVYHVIGYRRETVRENLLQAFPNKTVQERLEIEKKSYRYMCDMFIEMIKTMTISRAEINKRYVVTNIDEYLEIEKKGKSIALMCAHYASYEWAISMNHKITFEGFAVYKKIANPYFDKLVRKIRSRFKATLITTKKTKSCIEENHRKGVLALYGFASDQTPRITDKTYWNTFMGTETPIHVGAEVLAKTYDMNVVYLKSKRIKRGYYQATIELLNDDVKSVHDYEISENFIRKVEAQIYEAPEFYLWSHKRWKHKKV